MNRASSLCTPSAEGGLSDDSSTNTEEYSLEDTNVRRIAPNNSSKYIGDPLLSVVENAVSDELNEADQPDVPDEDLEYEVNHHLNGGGASDNISGQSVAATDQMTENFGLLIQDDASKSDFMYEENIEDICANPASFPSPLSNDFLFNEEDNVDRCAYLSEGDQNDKQHETPCVSSNELNLTFHEENTEQCLPSAREINHSCDIPNLAQDAPRTEEYIQPLDFSIQTSVQSEQDILDKNKYRLVLKLKAEKKIHFDKRGRPSTKVVNTIFKKWFLPIIKLERCDKQLTNGRKNLKQQTRKDSKGTRPSQQANQWTSGTGWMRNISRLIKCRNKLRKQHTSSKYRTRKMKRPNTTDCTDKSDPVKRQITSTKGQKPGPKSSYKKRVIKRPIRYLESSIPVRIGPRIKQISTPIDDYVIEYTTDENDNGLPVKSNQTQNITDPNTSSALIPDLSKVKQEPIDHSECNNSGTVCDEGSESTLRIENIRTIKSTAFQAENDEDKGSVDSDIDERSTVASFLAENTGPTNDNGSLTIDDCVSESGSIGTELSGKRQSNYVHKKFGHGKKAGLKNNNEAQSVENDQSNMEKNILPGEQRTADESSNSIDSEALEKPPRSGTLSKGIKKNTLKKMTKCVATESIGSSDGNQPCTLTAARLAQEFKSFNWLENKIRNGGIDPKKSDDQGCSKGESSISEDILPQKDAKGDAQNKDTKPSSIEDSSKCETKSSEAGNEKVIVKESMQVEHGLESSNTPKVLCSKEKKEGNRSKHLEILPIFPMPNIALGSSSQYHRYTESGKDMNKDNLTENIAKPRNQSVATIHPICSEKPMGDFGRDTKLPNQAGTAEEETPQLANATDKPRNETLQRGHIQNLNTASMTPDHYTLRDIPNLDDRAAMITLQMKFNQYKKNLKSLYDLSTRKQREREYIHRKIQKVMTNLNHVRNLCRDRIIGKKHLSGAAQSLSSLNEGEESTIDLTMSPPAKKARMDETSPSEQLDLRIKRNEGKNNDIVDLSVRKTSQVTQPITSGKGMWQPQKAHSRQTAYAIKVPSLPVKAHTNKKDLSHYTHMKCIYKPSKANESINNYQQNTRPGSPIPVIQSFKNDTKSNEGKGNEPISHTFRQGSSSSSGPPQRPTVTVQKAIDMVIKQKLSELNAPGDKPMNATGHAPDIKIKEQKMVAVQPFSRQNSHMPRLSNTEMIQRNIPSTQVRDTSLLGVNYSTRDRSSFQKVAVNGTSTNVTSDSHVGQGTLPILPPNTSKSMNNDEQNIRNQMIQPALYPPRQHFPNNPPRHAYPQFIPNCNQPIQQQSRPQQVQQQQQQHQQQQHQQQQRQQQHQHQQQHQQQQHQQQQHQQQQRQQQPQQQRRFPAPGPPYSARVEMNQNKLGMQQQQQMPVQRPWHRPPGGQMPRQPGSQPLLPPPPYQFSQNYPPQTMSNQMMMMRMNSQRQDFIQGGAFQQNRLS